LYQLTAEEKTTSVMVYTREMLVLGEAVTKQTVRISFWLRTEGAPDYIHILNPQVINLNSTVMKKLSFQELYLPTTQIIAIHLTPPAFDELDYDQSEENRKMQPVTLLIGSFVFDGEMRISKHAGIGSSIASVRSAWMSIYNVKISNPQIPQMGELLTALVQVRPLEVSFGLKE
jgi:hypothetical protein